MTTITDTGFELSQVGIQIDKDPEAQLIYTFDWVDWLPAGDSIANVDYTVAARVNDPEPLVKLDEGIQTTKTYVELSAGQLGKTYIVTAKVTTANGLIDRRSFRVNIKNRVAD